ncbi:MAG: response regulator [Pirellulaceae bacterium]|nr:response regulator [Pirellulaceae bacterium]HJN11448.1 response regulator [Pirellulaceae bacterium]
MASVLVVDDSPLDLRLASRILEEIGFKVRTAADGEAALEQLANAPSDVVLTDVQMPTMNGLQLVEAMGHRHPMIPIIMMTGCGSEETAVEALRSGAASYVPKSNLARDLVGTVKSVLSITRARRQNRTILDSMTQLKAEYVLNNTVDGLDSLIGHLKEQLRQMRLFGEGDIIRVGTALYESLINSIEHGNLEMPVSEREKQDSYYRRVLEERNRCAPFRSRHVRLTTLLTRSLVKFVVQDEGPGFDPSTLPDPTLPSNVGQTNGRGLFLIRTFMDEVTFNETGNVVTMIKHRVSR